MIVAIGASAGGLPSLRGLLERLPTGLAMAVIYLSHRAPDSDSDLRAVLQPLTKLKVAFATEGTTPESDHLYIPPPGSLVFLEGGALHVREAKAPAHEHVIDRLFRSIAEDAKDTGVGVLLSGTLSDGTQGLIEIRAAGGFTVVESLSTAQFPEMPRHAISAGAADKVLPPAGIAAELQYLAQQVAATSQLIRAGDRSQPNRHLPEILHLLHHHSGVDFRQYKTATILRRITRRMLATRRPDMTAYLELLREDQQELESLFSEFLIHVTQFFRDFQSLETRRDELIASIVEGRSKDRPIRVWVVGCSTGEEPYSIAILLHEYMMKHGLDIPLQVFATDLSEAVISTAREGSYPLSIAEDVSPDRLGRYFERTGEEYRISKALRAMCVFAVHDVTHDPPFSDIDLISCRNVLIYMSPPLQEKVFATLHYALHPNGYLSLGPAESISRSRDLFAPVGESNELFQRRDVERHIHLPMGRALGRTERSYSVGPAPKSFPLRADVQGEARRALLQRYAPPALVVDSDMQVVLFQGDVSRYLTPREGPASLDLLKMLHPGLVDEVHAALREAKETLTEVERRAHLHRDGSADPVQFQVFPLTTVGGGRHHHMIVFVQANQRGDTLRPPSPPLRDTVLSLLRPAKKVQELQRERGRLEQEATRTREYLQAVIQDYEATTEELRTTNEDALSRNEELQSANEELETTKEELQSTNEELSTLNDELHQQGREAQQANNDLVNLLEAVDLATLILGPDLVIRRFTPTAGKMLNVIPGDIGRPITDLQLGLRIADLGAMVRAVLERKECLEQRVERTSGESYLLRIHPYRTDDERVDGAVIVLLPDSRVFTG